MKTASIFWLLMLMMTSSSVWAYGSSSSTKACTKPVFTEFSHVENAGLGVKTEFSFVASANTHPETLLVTIKNQPLDVKVTPKNQSYLVTGIVPATLNQSTFRINISAEAGNACKGTDGWLVLKSK